MKNTLFILSIVLYACNTIPENSIIVENFPSTILLKSDSITNFDDELGLMALYDAGNFILCNSHKTAYHYSIYSKDSLYKLCNILKEGRGPGEFIAPDYFSQYQIENKETKIWILERAINKYFKINIDKTITQDSLFIEKDYDLKPFRNTDYREMYHINENLLFATEDQQDCQHVLLHLLKNEKEFIPLSLPFPNRPNVHEISQNISTKHPTKSYIASAYFNFPQIDLIDAGKIYKTIFYKKVIFPLETSSAQSNDEYFNCICSDTNFIYVLYNPTSDTPPKTSDILVFSWQGEAICKYVIPYSTYFFIDGKKNCLYTINTQKETYNTYICNLPPKDYLVAIMMENVIN